jgi:LPXTG-motif cell wall-anchored protein
MNPIAARQAKPLPADANLGAGQAPPGNRINDQGAVLGLDLLGAVGTDGLALRAQGNDLRMELTMSRTGSNVQPWLAALASLMVLAGGLWMSRRR